MPIPPSCFGRGHGDIRRPALIEEQLLARMLGDASSATKMTLALVILTRE